VRIFLLVLSMAVLGACGKNREEPAARPTGVVEQELQATDAVTATPISTAPTAAVPRARTAAAAANSRISATTSAVDSILGQSR
jgi:hypothetical protein